MMEIVVLVLVIWLLLLHIRHYLYRRQIKNICRRLEYMKDNDTNMLIALDIETKELVRLVSDMNEKNISSRNEINQYRHKDEMLKEAIANLSHDIRTPLTALNGYFQLLENSNDVADNKRYMGVIKGRINVLKDLLEELFTYTKLQDDSFQIDLELKDMQEIIRETVISFYQEFKDNGIVPCIAFEEDAVMGMCNDAALGRIIYNIIKNAVVHGNQSISLRTKTEGGYMLFICRNKVENPEEIDIKHVFDRFYKADKSRGNISTGLGLAIAKELAENMNGRLEAEIDNGEFGILFSIPVYVQPDTPPQAAG